MAMPASTTTTKPHHNLAAFALKPATRPLVVSQAPLPSLTDIPRGHVVIRVIDVAINPIDWKLQDSDFFGLRYPAVLGEDLAGIVEGVGEDVEDDGMDGEGQGVRKLRVGGRVIANANGLTVKKASHGAFQQYVIVPAHAVCELPYAIPTSLGVVLPLGISTASAGLYQQGYLALPFPSEDPKPLDRTVLIWGGSSSVGSCAIQLAVASGAEVVTTASERNFEYVKKLGAKHVFDYHDEDVEDCVIKALGGKTVAGAFCAVAGAVESCARIVDKAKGKAIVVSTAGMGEGIPGSVRVKMIASSDIFENDVGPYIWRKFLPKALESGTIVPAPEPLTVGEELRSVQLGLDKSKAGVSARKVVVTNIS